MEEKIQQEANAMFGLYTYYKIVWSKEPPLSFYLHRVEAVTSRLVQHLVLVPRVTAECLRLFEKVAKYCTDIDFAGAAFIGYDTFGEFNKAGRISAKDIGEEGMALLKELIDQHTLKPFGRHGCEDFLVNHIYKFRWLVEPQFVSTFNETTTEKIKLFHAAYLLENGERDSFETRRAYLKTHFLKEPSSLRTLSAKFEKVLISEAHLLRLIEIIGNSRSCTKFVPPERGISSVTKLLEEKGFKAEKHYFVRN